MAGNLMTPSEANNLAAAHRTFASMSLDMFQIEPEGSVPLEMTT